MKYFENFPTINYNGRRVKDITRRSAFLTAVQNNPYVYYPYTVSSNERAEDVARLYYGSVDYVWLIYLANNIMDPYHEWPMNENTFNDYLVDKYAEQSQQTGEDVLDWIRDEARDENIIYYIKQV